MTWKLGKVKPCGARGKNEGNVNGGRFFPKIDEWKFRGKVGIPGYEGREGYNNRLYSCG
jgi:hypothetical protein